MHERLSVVMLWVWLSEKAFILQPKKLQKWKHFTLSSILLIVIIFSAFVPVEMSQVAQRPSRCCLYGHPIVSGLIHSFANSRRRTFTCVRDGNGTGAVSSRICLSERVSS